MNTFDRNGLMIDDINKSGKWDLANKKTTLTSKKSLFANAFEGVKSAFNGHGEKKKG